jgi:hypothetical protein
MCSFCSLVFMFVCYTVAVSHMAVDSAHYYYYYYYYYYYHHHHHYYYYYYYYAVSSRRPFLPGTSRELTAVPTDQASSSRLQYFPYYG